VSETVGMVLACGGDTASAGSHRAPQLVEIANKPVLFHALDAMADAGIERVAIAVDGETSGPVRRAIGEGVSVGVRIDYLDVPQSTTLAEAVCRSRSIFPQAGRLAALGGGILKRGLRDHLVALTGGEVDALALAPRSRTGAFSARAAERAGGRSWGGADLDATGVLLFGPRCLELVDHVGSPSGGMGVAQLFHRLVEHDARARAHEVDDWWTLELAASSLLAANRLLLEGLGEDMAASAEADVTVHGPVAVHESAALESVVLRGPVMIGPGARVRHAYIGPYTSIGSDVVVEGAEIEHSLVQREASIKHVRRRLEGCVIGPRARVGTSLGLPTGLHLAIGEGAEVMLA